MHSHNYRVTMSICAFESLGDARRGTKTAQIAHIVAVIEPSLVFDSPVGLTAGVLDAITVDITQIGCDPLAIPLAVFRIFIGGSPCSSVKRYSSVSEAKSLFLLKRSVSEGEL